MAKGDSDKGHVTNTQLGHKPHKGWVIEVTRNSEGALKGFGMNRGGRGDSADNYER